MPARLAPWLSGPSPAMSLAHLALEASFNFLPVTYALLIPKLGLSYGQIGTAVLLMTIAGTTTQPLFGWLADRRDPRRMVVASIIWGGLLMGLVGFVPTYGVLALLVTIAALGSAAFHPSGALLASVVEAQNRGRAMSLFAVGGNLGAALSPLLVGVFLSLVGLAGTAIVIPLALLSGWLLARQFNQLPLPASHRSHGAAAVPVDAATGSMVALVAIILVVGARSYFQQALMTYLPQWLGTHGQSVAIGGAALSILLVAVSTGSLFGGTLSDRFGRVPVIAVSLIVMMPAQWLLLQSAGAVQLAAVLTIGLMIGASFPVTIVLAQEAWPQSVGLASAMVMGLGWLPSGLGAFTVGQIADRSSLTEALATLTFVPLVGLVALLVYVVVGRRGAARIKR
jgi:FSR family fosmidomycin resistance protein-like MFS transporter